MKLMKIYSNKNNFKTTKFSEGFNVILGKVKNSSDREKDTHNLGKTLLISIIDFLFLKSVGSSHIFKKRSEIFKDYTFYLEIALNNDNKNKYLTIKRSVKNKSKVSFKFHEEKHQNFTNCYNWDYENLSMNSKFPDKNAKSVLDNILSFDVLEDFNYRKSINYFLRTQSDYKSEFHLSKYKGKHKSWKPLLFELLGFNKEYMVKKYNLHDEYNEQKKLAKEVEDKFSIDAKEIDKIKGLIDIKKEEKNELESQIDEFDFYMKERGISKEAVEELESEISRLNSLEYKLKFEIEKIEDSLDIDIDFDFQEIKEIFKEVEIFFPDQLKKSYKELVQFNNEIINERSKYLKESLQKKNKKLDDVQKKLKKLNEKRKKKLMFLREKDSFKKFKNYQSDLVKIEKEISELENKLEKIDVVDQMNEKMKEMAEEIQNYSEKIDEQINKGNSDYKDIKLLFNKLLKKIINKNGILSIKQNNEGNVEFNAEIIDQTEDITSQAKGNTYKKILCACFDLSLLIHYSKKSFYKFVYHDGILESLDNRKKINYLDLIREISDDYNLQIIITLIEDDIPVDMKGNKYKFKDDEIALELDDSDDDKGRLFEKSF